MALPTKTPEYQRQWERTLYVVKQLKLGRAQADIAAEVELAQSTISKIAKKFDLARNQTPLQNYEKVIKAYKRGTKVKTICKNYSVDLTTLYKYLRRAGIKANRMQKSAD